MPDEKEFVIVAEKGGAKFYEHDEFVGAFHSAFVERLSALIPVGVTPRNAARIVRSMRSKPSHGVVLARALEILDEHGRVVTPEEAKQGALIAVFPRT